MASISSPNNNNNNNTKQQENCTMAIALLCLLGEDRRMNIQGVAIALRYVDDELKAEFAIWAGLAHMASLSKVWGNSPTGNPSLGLFLLSKWAIQDSSVRYNRLISKQVTNKLDEMFSTKDNNRSLAASCAHAIQPFLQFSIAVIKVNDKGVKTWVQLAEDGFQNTGNGTVGIRMGAAEVNINVVVKDCMRALSIHITDSENINKFNAASSQPLFYDQVVDELSTIITASPVQVPENAFSVN